MGTVRVSIPRGGVPVFPDASFPESMPGQCPWQGTSAAVPAPPGILLARLTNPPATIKDSVSVAFTGGCTAAQFRRVLPGTPPLLLHPGLVRYSGSAGTLIVQTIEPTARALKAGLDLGNRDGQLPNGTPLFSQVISATGGLGAGPGLYANNLLFQWNGFVVAVSSSELSLDQLRALVTSVVVS